MTIKDTDFKQPVRVIISIVFTTVFTIVFSIAFLLSTGWVSYAEDTVKGQGSEEEFKKGEIIETVVCKENTKQRYSLYLPSSYTSEKKWPILYAFDAGARYKIPMERFRETAEKYGYIVVCSHNVRNGPGNLVSQAIFELWKDTRRRLSIDMKRIYATGFSGGARASSRFHLMTGQSCAGIIACGAGLSLMVRDLEEVKPAFFYGIVGLEDFNYKELMALSKDLTERNIAHHVEVIDGDHRWPPKDDCIRALSFMVLTEMKRGIRDRDPQIIKDIRQKMDVRAHNLEIANRPYYSADAFEHIIESFEGLTSDPNTAIKEKIKTLKNTDKYKRFEKEEAERQKKEMGLIQNATKVFHFIEHPGKKPMNLKDIFKAFHLDYLQKTAAKKDDYYNSAMAARVIADIRSRAGSKAGEYMRSGELKKSSTYFEILIQIDPENPFNLYNLACVYSRDNQKKKALKYLKTAIKSGFKNKDHMSKDTDLDNIREEKKFKEIMDSI